MPPSDASPINVKLLALSVDIILKSKIHQLTVNFVGYVAFSTVIYNQFCFLDERTWGAHRAGGMYFLDTPSGLFSTKVSWKGSVTLRLRYTCKQHIPDTKLCFSAALTSGAVSPSLLSACLLGVTVTKGAEEEYGHSGV